MEARKLRDALASALHRRQPLLQYTDCVRLLNGEASGSPGVAAELFGPHCVIYDYGGAGDFPEEEGAALLAEFGWQSLLVKDRARSEGQGRGDTRILAGVPPESFQAREGSLAFRLELLHPRNVGLFLDMRDLRAWLAENSSGAKVLNLFCYTGALGTAALAGGAVEATQVDISRRYLGWARENLALNGLPMERCRFSSLDAERYLDWAGEKGLAFDQVFLDPPVFSRFGGKVYRFQADFFRLAAKAFALLPRGVLHASTHFTGIDETEFAAGLREAARRAGRKLEELRRLPLPEDFDPLPGGRPEGNALIFRAQTA